ncbi:penicillin-binding protein 1A family [Firmicutes bacterium CAG:582]|nr:penicillin-binding protein 1A family [Firmicutes bacterium CAG:582]
MKHIKNLFKISILLFISTLVIIIGIYVYSYFMPAMSLNSANSYYLYDNKDNVVYQGSNKSAWVSLKEIDPKFLNYIISIEDQHFYHHLGFDIPRILKTLFTNIKSGKILAGASSISQQYVKNLYLTFDQTWERKIEEAFLTIKLETHYSKDEILEGYLNTIYFGEGVYGIKNAANYYFNKEPNDLTDEEAIILAGIPKSPNNYNPISNMDACMKRVNVVKSVLKENGTITDDAYNNLNFDNLNLYGKKSTNNLNTLMYYQDAVMDELSKINSIPEKLINSGGIRIYTNLDLDTQKAMDEEIEDKTLDDDNQVAGIVVNPRNGKVVALAGGKNYSKSQYNRVLKSKRQVGSTIKPFLYYAALNSGMTEASTFKSEKTSFVFQENKVYNPTNYGNKYANKDISMALALAYSDNIYAVKTHLFLGENTLVDTLKTCGLKENLAPNPSLALGASEINMLDYATAYTTLASNGYKRELYFINKIEDVDGNVLYIHKNKEEKVLNDDALYILNEMMRNTYNYNYVDYNSPTVIYLNGKLNQKYALKSGTTDNDYWISGYNNNVLSIFWAGNDQNEDTPKAYSKIIKDIWLRSVNAFTEDIIDDEWYSLPKNVIAIPVNPKTGKYAAKSKELFYFIDGTQTPYIK